MVLHNFGSIWLNTILFIQLYIIIIRIIYFNYISNQIYVLYDMERYLWSIVF